MRWWSAERAGVTWRSALRSGCSRELVERGRHREVREGVGAELVVAAAEVLDERVASYHGLGAAVGLEAAHWSEPGLEAGVV